MSGYKKYWLRVGEWKVGVFFEKAEQTVLRGRFIGEFEEVFGKGGFLTDDGIPDFTVSIENPDKFSEVIDREGGQKYFYLFQERHLEDKKIRSHYNIGLGGLQVILREVCMRLFQEKGFILHASACLSGDEVLYAFLANSGGGKSTTAGMMEKEGFAHFADDIIGVCKSDQGFRYYSLPVIEKEKLPVLREVDKAKFFFVQKSNEIKKERIEDRKKLLDMVIRQVWLAGERMSERMFSRVVEFVEKGEFWILKTMVDSQGLKELMNEA